MKIFTFLTFMVKLLTGKIGRFNAFYEGSKINPLIKNKTVVMKNFFIALKELFTLTHNRYALPQNLTAWLRPVRCCNTTETENLLRNIHSNDVAQPAASFAFIPVMDNPEKNLPMKSAFPRLIIFAFAFVIANLIFVNSVSAKATTWTNTAGGSWATAGNWSNGVPVAGDDVTISNIITGTSTITNVPQITLNSLTFTVSCVMDASATGNILTISASFSVASGVTISAGPNTRINTTLAAGCIGTVAGTYTQESGGTTRTFTNSGNLTITSTGRINGAGAFTLSAGATLQIGSAVGILTGTGNTGNIQVTGARTYPQTANYAYIGGGNQATGNGLPVTVTSLAVKNSTTLTLPSAKAISGNLSIEAGSSINLGTFTHSAGTLTLGGQGTVNGSWGSTTSAATNKNNTFFAATTGLVNVTTSTCTPPAAPTVSTPVKYCVGASVSPLTATGTNLLWYSTLTGPPAGTATAPTPSTASAGNTSYFVSQTVGCEGPRAEIVVTINSNPTSTVNGSTNITCFGAADGTITILANGGTGPYSYSVDDGLNWLPSVTNPFIYPGLSANVPYKVKVQDLNGCKSQTF